MAKDKTPLNGVLIRLELAADDKPVYFIPMHKLEKEFRLKLTKTQQAKIDAGPALKNVNRAWQGTYVETDDIENIDNNGQAAFRSGSV